VITNSTSLVCASNHRLFSEFFGGGDMKYVVPPVGILGGHVPLIPPAIAAPGCLALMHLFSVTPANCHKSKLLKTRFFALLFVTDSI